MNKKRIRQMDLLLRRRLSDRPASDFSLLQQVETELSLIHI